MSGICGIVRFDEQNVKRDDVQKMLDKMHHRGDDTTQVWLKNTVALGHKMLWSTPESLYEKQPIVSKDGTLVLTADARIDNRTELCEKLEIEENNFDVITDSDLILWSYQKWGKECTKHFVGDFAFAVWDNENHTLYCARDHLGIKPFYYYTDDDKMIFSSEISSLFANEEITKEVNIEALESSLLFDSIAYEQTYFKNIMRIKRNAWLLCDMNGHYITQEYWDPSDIELDKSITFEDASMKLKSLYQEVLESKLRSHYPISFELSGGLDSSSVVSFSHQIGMAQPAHLYALRFGDLLCDEGEYIKEVSKQVDKEVENIRADLLEYEKKDSLKNFYSQFSDWPQDLFFIPHLVLAREAAQSGCRVMLTGQGGDEVFQGSRYMYADFIKQLDFTLFVKQFGVSKYKYYDLLHFTIKPLIPSFIKKIIRPFLNQKEHRNRKLYRHYLKKLEYKNKDIKSLSNQHTLRMIFGTEHALWSDGNIYNLFGDTNIEVRHPLFDIRLIEFRLKTPADFFYSHNRFKYLFRSAMKGILPELIRDRDDKANFDEVVKMQLESEIKSNNYLGDIQQLHIKKIINKQVWDILEKYHAKKGFDNDKIFLHWKLVNLEYWYLNNFMIE